MKTPESYEKDDTCAYLKSQGAWYFRAAMNGYGKSGVPDIIACVPRIITPAMVGMRFGAFVGVESKREGKEPTPIQYRRIEEISHASGIALWGTANKVMLDLHNVLVSSS